MEDQVRSVAVNRTGSGWIVSPAFDLFFLANLGWLAFLLPGFARDGGTPVDFWQIYFLTLPHRWITLLLVALDPDRRDGRGQHFVLYGLLALVLVVGARLITGGFVCLLLIDYDWNGWHFASQHAGVLRMYGRKVGGGSEWLERYSLRAFIFYAIVRTAGWSTGWIEADPESRSWLYLSDLIALAIPAVLLGIALAGSNQQRLGKIAYLSSVCLLYSGLIVALRENDGVLVLAFTAASSTFHAVEYLAVVTHYSWRRQASGSRGAFRFITQNWLTYLALYIFGLGVLGTVIDQPSLGLVEWWQGLNLWAAFLHYTYDGMFWKLRRPATAQALGLVRPMEQRKAESDSLARAECLTAYDGLAFVARARKAYADAETAYREALERLPSESAYFHLHLRRHYHAGGQPLRALESLSTAANLDPKSGAAARPLIDDIKRRTPACVLRY